MKLNWSTKKLGEIRKEIKKEKAPVEAMPYIEIGNVNIESKKVNFTEKGAVKGSIFCPEESILISRVRPTRGAVVLTDRKYAISSAFTIIKPKINSRLLFYFLTWNKKFFEYLGNLQKGTSYPSVKESDILDFEISFPEDKVEQQKIVYILDNIQNMIRVQEKIIEKTKELKKSLLNEIFNSKVKSQKSKFKIQKLLNIAAVKYGKAKPKEESGDIPVIGSGGVYGYTNKALIHQPTIIIGRKGTAGMIYLMMKPCWPSDTTFYLEIDFKRVDPRYLYEFMKTKVISGEEAKTTLPSLKREVLENIEIKILPLPEQREIAEILQTIDQKIEIDQKKKALYEELFKTMLNKLMTGEIKVDNLKI